MSSTTSRVAAFAQRSRVKGANQAGLTQAKSLFENTWSNFVISEVTQPLVEKAGMYAEAFALRGYEQFALPLTFACFDRRLSQAAALLQLEVLL
jgi:hypothetical protein